jgi:quinol monooxygenase YgiN
MELEIIARFHAREGRETDVAAMLAEQVGLARNEPGCLEIAALASTGDPRLFFIHSRWSDEAGFDVHAELPRTIRFVEMMEALINHPFDAARVRKIG